MTTSLSSGPSAPEAPGLGTGSNIEEPSIEEWLRAAGLLLAQRAPLDAVRALHWAAAQALNPADTGNLPNRYHSLREGEKQHRRLLHAFDAQKPVAGRQSLREELRRRLPLWVSWAIVIVVGGGLSLRYGWGVLDRMQWQREHPDGPWISRYYWSRGFEDTPLVRYDVAVNYDWGRKAPADAMLRDRWSVRWDTCVVVRADMTLSLSLLADDAAQLFVDGVSQIRVRHPGKKKAQVQLRAGLRHLRIEFQEGQGQAVVRLQGLEFAGTDAYHFQRPVLRGDEVHCEAPGVPTSTPAVSGASTP